MLAPDEIAKRVDGAIELRRDDFRARVSCVRMLSADQHEIHLAMDCTLRAADTAADRTLLAEHFLSSETALSIKNVASYLSRAAQPAIEAYVATLDAGMLHDAPGREKLSAVATSAIDAAAFASGLQLIPPMRLDVASPSLERSRSDAAQRARTKERTTGHVEQVRHARELVEEFERLRAGSPDISAGMALEQISPADRGGVLESLLMASAGSSEPRQLYVVAGESLLRIDPRAHRVVAESLIIPTTLGPIRSIRANVIDGKRVLLVGARLGVMLINPTSPADCKCYVDPQTTSPLGFNSAVLHDGLIIASHSEAGIVTWQIGDPDAPATRRNDLCKVEARAREPVRDLRLGSIAVSGTTDAPRTIGPRNLLCTSRGDIFFTVGGDLHSSSTEQTIMASPDNQDWITLLEDGGDLVAVTEDATIARLDSTSFRAIDVQRRSGRIVTASTLPWLDGIRLLMSHKDGAVECIGMDDQVVTQFCSSHRACKIVAACADVVAAVSSDRQRLIFWHSWDGRKPIAELNIAAQTKHRIADVTFL